jgi:HNH endonuclease
MRPPEGPCAICGTFLCPTWDHIVPRSKGGSDDPSNLRVLCGWCNSTRNNQDWSDDRVYERRLSNYLDKHRWSLLGRLQFLPRYLRNPRLPEYPNGPSERTRRALLALPLFGGCDAIL